MKYLKDERGVVPVLVTILVLVLVAAAGVAVYNVSKSHQKDAQSPTASPSTTSSPDAAPSSVPTPASSYLDIKELGIKVRLTDDIKDATYGYDNQFLSKYPDPQQVGISSQSLTNAAATCKPGTSGPLGTIGRTKNPNQGFETLTPNGSTVFKIGDYYVYYQTPQSPCGAPQGVQSSQLQSFEQAFKTVQPD